MQVEGEEQGEEAPAGLGEVKEFGTGRGARKGSARKEETEEDTSTQQQNPLTFPVPSFSGNSVVFFLRPREVKGRSRIGDRAILGDLLLARYSPFAIRDS